MLLAEGERFAGQFQIESTLREDALGALYRVTDVSDPSGRAGPLSLLVFDPRLTGDGNALISTQDAVLQAQGLTHKNLARIHGWWVDGDLHALAMERVEGRTLGRLLEKRSRAGKTFNLKGAYNLVAHVCNALKAAQIPSGLLRPSCIAVTTQGRVKLEGLALEALRPEAVKLRVSMDRWDALCFAGETGEEGLTGVQSDLKALGAILRAMMTGVAEADAPLEGQHPALHKILDRCRPGAPEGFTKVGQLKSALSALTQAQLQGEPSAVPVTPAPASALQEKAAPAPVVTPEAPATPKEATAAGQDATAMVDAIVDPPAPQAPEAHSTPEVDEGSTQVVDVPIDAIQALAVPTAKVPPAEAPAAEVPTAEVPTAEVPTAEVPTAEVPAGGPPKDETTPEADAVGAAQDSASEEAGDAEGAPEVQGRTEPAEEAPLLLDDSAIVMEPTAAPEAAPPAVPASAAKPPVLPPSMPAAPVASPPSIPAVPPPLTPNRRRGGAPTLNKLPEHDAAPVSAPGGFEIPDLGYHSALDPDALRWIVRRNGLDYGPYSSKQVVEQLFKEEIDTEQLLFDVETEEIRPLSDIEFFEEILHKWAHEKAARKRKQEDNDIKRKNRRRSILVNGSLGASFLAIALAVGGYFWYQSTLPTPVVANLGQAIMPFEAALPSVALPDEAPETAAERVERVRLAARSAAAKRARAEQAQIRKERLLAESSTLDMSAGEGAVFKIEALNAAVAARQSRLSKCLTAEARRDASVKVLKVKMTALPKGKVINVTLVGGSTVGNRCVREALGGMSVPAFSGTNRTVTLPFTIRK
ncbi:MAG: hypothetical protein ACE366_06455 [Bradymonadia bacterium]